MTPEMIPGSNFTKVKAELVFELATLDLQSGMLPAMLWSPALPPLSFAAEEPLLKVATLKERFVPSFKSSLHSEGREIVSDQKDLP